MLNSYFSGHAVGLAVLVDGPSAQPVSLTGFRQRESGAIDHDEYVPTGIRGLLTRRGPAAVASLVMAIWIDAVKRVAIWAWPHVAKKRSKVAKPRLLHCDAARTIQPVVLVSGIRAAALGVLPRSVLGRNASAMFGPMPSVRVCGSFALKAATTARLLAAQLLASNFSARAAVAQALPLRWPICVGNAPLDKQSANATAGQINIRTHMWILALWVAGVGAAMAALVAGLWQALGGK